MAATGTSALSSVILSLLAFERINSQINRRVVLANLVPIEVSGDPISWNVKFRGRTAAAGVAQTDAAPTATQDLRKQATLSMGEYSDTASVTGRAQSAAALAPNPLGVANGNNLMLDELNDAIGNVAESIGSDLYAGDGSTANPITGLALAVDGSAGTTYAGLAVNTYSEWASTESAGLLVNLSFEMIRTFLTAVHTASGKRPGLLVTTPTIFDSVCSLFAAYPTYVTEIMVPNASGGMSKRALASGTRAIYCEGAWLIEDPDCTSGTIYALQLDELRLCTMPHAEYVMAGQNPGAVAAEFKRVTGDDMSAAEASQLIGRAMNGGLIPYIKQLGATGNQDSKQVIVYAQLRTKRRNVHGKLTLS